MVIDGCGTESRLMRLEGDLTVWRVKVCVARVEGLTKGVAQAFG